MEKETYEKPEVTKVDFKFEEAIAASGCTPPTNNPEDGCLE